jgi:uncharacterized protein (UPF0548 family)
MFFLGRPSDERLAAERRRLASCPLSYAAVGATRAMGLGAKPPRGFRLDHNRVLLGHGAACYEAAAAALRRWEMFSTPFTWLAPRHEPREGDVVSMLARTHGVWSASFCRVVYVEPPEAASREAGVRAACTFAYGTLVAHVESGEERFRVEWRDDDGVWYDLLAFSRPHHPLAVLGSAYARLMQLRFVRMSKAAMVAAAQRASRGEKDPTPSS